MDESLQTENLSDDQLAILNRWKKKQKVQVSDDVKADLERYFQGEVLFNEPLSKHTYIKVGGPADVFLKPANKESLIYALRLAQKNGLPCTFHGSGANTLVKDGGIRGFVISVHDSLKECKVLEQNDQYIDLYCESGLPWSRAVHLAKDLGAADFAPLAGIPGSIGGLIKMNAGTPVREIKDFVRSVTILTKDLEEKTLSRDQLDFEYRKLKISGQNFILSTVFRLQDLMASEDVAGLIKQYQQKRSDKQPLEYPNLGSMFKNPQPVTKNQIVATAGQLIEESGLKNVRVGGARISPKHANFIINEGNATAKDILSLISLIKDRVKMSSGVVLETEVKIVGDD